MSDHFEYLNELNSACIRFGLGPISRLLDRLHNPQDTYRTALVGGTNGKGSIAAMLASILKQAGFKVGLYTSPHLIDVRERIRVNGRIISHEKMISCMRDVKKEIREEITYFEFLTAVAFLHFYNEKVDMAVLEVGMGGRLDATNVINPLVSVISNIALEHRDYLGNSLAEITAEKGGIIKDHGVCITAARQKQVMNVLEDICQSRKAELLKLGREFKVEIKNDGTFSYKSGGNNYKHLVCPMRGRHQIENTALAIGAIESMRKQGIAVDDKCIFNGIRDTQWEGRLEMLQKEPMLLLDGAHNPSGISVLCRALKTEFVYRRLIVIFAVLDDKDHVNMLRRIVPLSDIFIITKPHTCRAMPPEKVASIASRYTHSIDIIDNTADALQHARSLAGVDDLICVAGSLYLVGEIKKAFLKQESDSKQ